jgi:hypothetical protein
LSVLDAVIPVGMALLQAAIVAESSTSMLVFHGTAAPTRINP